LAHKAESLGYHPEVILSGRRVNNNMGMFVANKVVKLMIQNGLSIKESKALVLGFTFKENCPDIRNSKVVDIYTELKEFGVIVEVYDPHVDSEEVLEEYDVHMTSILTAYDAIILAVAHDEFLKLDIQNLKKNTQSVVFDIKGVLDRKTVDGRL